MKKSKSNCDGNRVVDDSGVENKDAVASRCCFAKGGVIIVPSTLNADVVGDSGNAERAEEDEDDEDSADNENKAPSVAVDFAVAFAATVGGDRGHLTAPGDVGLNELLLLPSPVSARRAVPSRGSADSIPRSSCCDTASNHCSSAIMHAFTALILCTEVAE